MTRCASKERRAASHGEMNQEIIVYLSYRLELRPPVRTSVLPNIGSPDPPREGIDTVDFPPGLNEGWFDLVVPVLVNHF